MYYEIQPYTQTTQESQIGERANFRDVLPYLVFSPHRGLPTRVREVDLDFAGIEARQASFHSQADPRKREFGKLAYVTPARAIAVEANFTRGTEHQVRMTVNAFRRMDPEQSQDRYLAADIHSHGIMDVPHSFQDLVGLFINHRSVSLQSGLFATSAAVIATRSIIMAAFRSAETPLWGKYEAQQKVDEWTRQSYVDREEETDPYSHALEVMAMLREISREHHLRIFTCPIYKSNATLQTA